MERFDHNHNFEGNLSTDKNVPCKQIIVSEFLSYGNNLETHIGPETNQIFSPDDDNKCFDSNHA